MIDVHVMPAGREMDGLISEHVFGNRSCVCCHGATCSRCDCPKYSTDIAAAWNVLETLNDRCRRKTSDKKLAAILRFRQETRYINCRDASDAALSICRAALRVLGDIP